MGRSDQIKLHVIIITHFPSILIFTLASFDVIYLGPSTVTLNLGKTTQYNKPILSQ